MTEMSLPDEVVGLILNGVCEESGRPLLDPRYRFLAGRACRQWHQCVANPSATDAARMRAQAPPALADAWMRGRLACMSVLIDDLLAVDNASLDRLSSALSECGENGADVIAPIVGMAGRDASGVVGAFALWVSWLSGSTVVHDWSSPLDLDDRERRAFPSADTARVDDDDDGDGDRCERERRATCWLARLACLFGHADTVHALFGRFNVLRAGVVFRCADDAVAADRADIIEALLRAIADHADDTPTDASWMAADPCDTPQESGIFFFATRRALYKAASAGSVSVLRALLGGDDPHDQRIRKARDIAARLQRIGRPWETLAAARCPGVGIFERAGLPYNCRHVGAAAIAAGRTDVIDWLVENDRDGIMREPGALVALLRHANNVLCWKTTGGGVMGRYDSLDAHDAASFDRGIVGAVSIAALSEPTYDEVHALFHRAHGWTHHLTALSACIIQRWLAPGWDGLSNDSRRWILGSLCEYASEGRWSSIEHVVGGCATPLGNLWSIAGDLMVCRAYGDVVTMDKGIYQCLDGNIRMTLWLACLCGAVPRSAESDALCRDMGVPTESTVSTDVWRSWCTPSRIATDIRQGDRPPLDYLTHAASARRSLMDRMALLFSSAGLV